MEKVTIEKTLLKDGKLYARAIRTLGVLENIPVLQPAGFVAVPQTNTTQLGFLLTCEGRHYVVALESIGQPAVNADEAAFYRNQQNFLKLTKSDTAILKTSKGSLRKLFDELCRILLNAKCITALGASPFTPDTIAQLEVFKQTMETFLED